MRGWILLVVLALPVMGGGDPEADQYTALKGDYVASHILIAHLGALRADPSITRNKPEALAIAEDLLAQIQADPERFEVLARESSDGATAPLSGYLGVVSWGKFDPKFERAVKRLAPGEIVDKPVLTDFGYHIIRREPMRVKNYAANLLVVTYRGAVNIEGIPYRRKNRTQSREDALAAIEKLATEVTADNFSEMVFQHGDFRPAGGFFGNFKLHDSPTTELIVAGLAGRAYGALTEVLDLPFGYAIAQRVKVEKLACARILVMHNEVEDAPQWMTRTKAEAQAIMDDLVGTLRADPGDFAKMVKKHSEGMYNGSGGVQPLWLAGEKDFDLEKALRALAVGEVAHTVLDTSEGLVLLKRLDPAELEGS